MWNLECTITEFELEIILIIISCVSIISKKIEDRLQVICTARCRDQTLYPSSLALAKTSSVSAVRLSNLRALPLMYQAFASCGLITDLR